MMNTELYNENFEVLHKKFYPKWIYQVRTKLPSDYNISDNEIVSEITIRCLELAETFKGGFFPSYCDLYVVCEVVKRLWNEYRKLDHSLIADAYEEFENGEDYVQQRQYVDYVEPYAPNQIYDILERNDILSQLFDNATADDKIILRLRFNQGKTLDEIAEVFGITKQALSKKLNKLISKIKDHTK